MKRRLQSTLPHLRNLFHRKKLRQSRVRKLLRNQRAQEYWEQADKQRMPLPLHHQNKPKLYKKSRYKFLRDQESSKRDRELQALLLLQKHHQLRSSRQMISSNPSSRTSTHSRRLVTWRLWLQLPANLQYYLHRKPKQLIRRRNRGKREPDKHPNKKRTSLLV
jgi:hypothetical protein